MGSLRFFVSIACAPASLVAFTDMICSAKFYTQLGIHVSRLVFNSTETTGATCVMRRTEVTNFRLQKCHNIVHSLLDNDNFPAKNTANSGVMLSALSR